MHEMLTDLNNFVHCFFCSTIAITKYTLFSILFQFIEYGDLRQVNHHLVYRFRVVFCACRHQKISSFAFLFFMLNYNFFTIGS